MTKGHLTIDPMNGRSIGLAWFTPVKSAGPMDPIGEGSI